MYVTFVNQRYWLFLLSTVALISTPFYYQYVDIKEFDLFFNIHFLLLLLITLVSLVYQPKLPYYIRFGVALTVCSFLNRNLYLTFLEFQSPVLASILSQSINLVFSYIVNQNYTCPPDSETERKYGDMTRKVFYVIVYLGELSLHAAISSYLLTMVSPFWTWLITGSLLTPYSMVMLRIVFSEKQKTIEVRS